ncbi:MAG: hypothetical protein R2702_11650 [Acidimicrobiales bacterium]
MRHWTVLLVALLVVRAATGLRFDRWVARAIAVVADAIPRVVFGALFIVAVLPAHLLGRRSWRRARAAPPAWTPVAQRDSTLAATSLAAGADAPAPRRGLLWSLGLATLLIVGNYGVGLAWDRISPRGVTGPVGPPPTLLNVTGSDPPPDPRAKDPAMGGAPWADRYFDELNSVQVEYWPFVLFRNRRYTGEYVNGEGWTRRSWQPPETGSPRPLLSFYGGSTTFGVGQRDAHTIPSEVARLAAAEGYPVEVANHGLSGFVSWQEMMLFEHFTAAGERPLRAVFYDGTNEVYAQRQDRVRGNPTDTEVDQIQARLYGAGSVTTEATPVATDDRSWFDRYEEHSALHRLVDEARAALGGEPAGASPADEEPAPYDPRAIGRAAVDVYERSRTLIQAIAEPAGIEPAFFWQPVPGDDDRSSAYPWAVDQLTEPTVDISDCLDGHSDVYLSDSHTNEQGAQLVAACLWDHLGPAVRGWYRDEGIDRQEPVVDDGGDDILPALGPADLTLDPASIGPGWTEDVAIPSPPATCASLEPGATDLRRGPGLARNDQVTARLIASIVPFDSPEDAEAALQVLASESGRRCLEDGAAGQLSGVGTPTWSSPVAGDLDATTGTRTWRSDVRVDSIRADARWWIAVHRRGAELLVIQVIGTDATEVESAGARALAQLAP